jgi:hypothetical protein
MFLGGASSGLFPLSQAQSEENPEESSRNDVEIEVNDKLPIELKVPKDRTGVKG